MSECLQAAYLVAVLAEHHCTHQLITAQGSISALLQILHTAGQPHTTSRTLDLISGSTAEQAGHSNSSPSTAQLAQRAAGPFQQPSAEASAGASLAGMTHAVSDVMSLRRLEAEGEAAGGKVPGSAPGEEVCRQEQSPAHDDDSSASSAQASAESTSHNMHQSGPQHRVGIHGMGVCSHSSNNCEAPNQAPAGAHDGNEEVGSRFTATDNVQSHDRGSTSGVEESCDAGEGVSSTSIHSRLLRAARAAKSGNPGEACPASAAVSETWRRSYCCCCCCRCCFCCCCCRC